VTLFSGAIMITRTMPPSRLRARLALVLALFVLASCAQVNPPHDGTREAPSNCTQARHYQEVGTASWYGREHHGRRTASGQTFNMHGLTAAHRTLPFGSRIRVTNVGNGRSVVLTVNDRGPFIKGRFLDVSYRAARDLNFVRAGITRVKVEAVHAC
jgi:rare lipoprotein A